MKKLRQVQVRYTNGLNSKQIWDILNYLIAQLCAPYVLYSDMAVETALSCLSISTNNRRKIGSLESNAMLDRMFNAVCDYTPTEAGRTTLFEQLQQLGVERNVFVDHLQYSYAYAVLPDTLSRRKVRDHVRLWSEYYETFRRDVINRYYNLIESFANTNQYVKSRNGLETSRGDMFNVYIISAMHALDKFIPYKGTLTQYIKTWFQNAEGSSNFVVYDGEAFDLNRAMRKEIQTGARAINNKSIPIDDRENTLAVDFDGEYSASFEHYVHALARFENAPVLFMAQNLPYTLHRAQLERIATHNATQESGHG